MSEGKHIFFELVTKVEMSGLFKEILANELPRYQITLNKCDWLDIKSIVNLYENIEKRYFLFYIGKGHCKIPSETSKFGTTTKKKFSFGSSFSIVTTLKKMEKKLTKNPMRFSQKCSSTEILSSSTSTISTF